MIIETTSANETLEVQVRRISGTDGAIQADRTALTIVKLPDDGEYIRIEDVRPNTDNLNTAPPGLDLTWDTDVEEDAAFTHDDTTDSPTVQVNEDGDYLFLADAFAQDASGNRTYVWQRWYTNSANVAYAGGAGFQLRGNADDWSGNALGALVGLSNGDTVKVTSERLADDTSSRVGDNKGLQAVWLGSLFGSVIENVGAFSVADTTADLVGTLNAKATNYTVYVYYGENDNADAAAWRGDGTATRLLVGAFTNVTDLSVTGEVSALTQSTTYYFTMVASNTVTNFWATPNATFDTVTAETDPPVTTPSTRPTTPLTLRWTANSWSASTRPSTWSTAA